MPSTSPATSELPVKRLENPVGLSFPLQHRQRHVLFRRHLREQPRNLEGAHQTLANPPHGAEVRDILAVQDDPPGARMNLPRHQIDEGGLAGAVRADQGEPLSRRHGERDVPADGEAAEILGQALDAKEIAHAFPLFARLPDAENLSSRPLSPPGAASTTAISRAPTIVIQWNGLIAETICSKPMKITVPTSAP